MNFRVIGAVGIACGFAGVIPWAGNTASNHTTAHTALFSNSTSTPVNAQQTPPANYSLPTPPPVPPASFNPLTASPASLRLYGFPAKPTQPAALASWETAMEQAKTYVTPEQTYSAVTHHATYYNNIWAGYAAHATSVYDVSAQWKQSSYNEGWDINPSDPSFWVGMGGVNSANLVQSGADSGANNAGGTSQYEFWVEDYSNDPSTNGTVWEAKPAVSAGNILYDDVTYQGSTSQAFLENVSTGQYTTVSFKTPNYDGSTADYINEAVNGTYTDWSSWGSTTFSSGDFNASSGGGAFGAFPTTKYIMTSNGNSSGTLESSPGSINSSQDGFTVTAY